MPERRADRGRRTRGVATRRGVRRDRAPSCTRGAPASRCWCARGSRARATPNEAPTFAFVARHERSRPRAARPRRAQALAPGSDATRGDARRARHARRERRRRDTSRPGPPPRPDAPRRDGRRRPLRVRRRAQRAGSRSRSRACIQYSESGGASPITIRSRGAQLRGCSTPPCRPAEPAALPEAAAARSGSNGAPCAYSSMNRRVISTAPRRAGPLVRLAGGTPTQRAQPRTNSGPIAARSVAVSVSRPRTAGLRCAATPPRARRSPAAAGSTRASPTAAWIGSASRAVPFAR